MAAAQRVVVSLDPEATTLLKKIAKSLDELSRTSKAASITLTQLNTIINDLPQEEDQHQ